MTKNESAFQKAYGATHFATDILSKMCDDKGNLKPDVTVEQIELLKTTLREASCHALAINAVHDGQPAR